MAAASAIQTNPAATTARAATATEYQGLALVMAATMLLPNPSAHGLAFVHSAPFQSPLVLSARR